MNNLNLHGLWSYMSLCNLTSGVRLNIAEHYNIRLKWPGSEIRMLRINHLDIMRVKESVFKRNLTYPASFYFLSIF